MEIEGHPTQDLIEELERRGGVRITGSAEGPNVESLRFATERLGNAEGFWVFLPTETFMTGFDEIPPS